MNVLAIGLVGPQQDAVVPAHGAKERQAEGPQQAPQQCGGLFVVLNLTKALGPVVASRPRDFSRLRADYVGHGRCLALKAGLAARLSCGIRCAEGAAPLPGAVAP